MKDFRMMSVGAYGWMLWIVLMTTVVTGQPAAPPTAPASVSPEPDMPYIAEVVGSNVNVRSGPGVAYYYTSKLSAPSRVTVVSHKFTWAQIIPTEGSFSWVSKNYVKLDPSNPGIGIITGEAVRIWAGSDAVEPMRSTSLQAKLNDGDTVKLIGPAEAKGDYYKIVPPPSARLWIQREFIKYVGPAPKVTVIPPRPGAEKPADTTTKPVVPVVPTTITPPVTPTVPTTTTPPVEAPATTPDAVATPTTPTTEPPKPTEKPDVSPEKVREKQLIQECRKLAEQVMAELNKPLQDQNYSEYRAALDTISNDPMAGNAKIFADYYLDRIDAYELAKEAAKAIQQQDSALDKIRKDIRKDLADKLAAIPDPGKYILTGIIRESLVYTPRTGQKRFLMVNETGKILGYAIPANSAVEARVRPLLGRKVGLVGKPGPDSKNPLALIEFTEIEELKEKTPERKPAPEKPAEAGTSGDKPAA